MADGHEHRTIILFLYVSSGFVVPGPAPARLRAGGGEAQAGS
ncbi:hypothetical protein [Streptomyces nitrosporeus]